MESWVLMKTLAYTLNSGEGIVDLSGTEISFRGKCDETAARLMKLNELNNKRFVLIAAREGEATDE